MGFFVCAFSMGAHLQVQVPLLAVQGEPREVQLLKGNCAWERSVKHESMPMYKDRIKGAAKQAERAYAKEAYVIQAKRR